MALWSIAPNAYWRLDGDVMIVAVNGQAFRLNAHATQIARVLLQGGDISQFSDGGIVLSELTQSGIIVPAVDRVDPMLQHLQHLP